MTRGSEARWLRRQAPGTLGGRSEQATPAPSRPRAATSPLRTSDSPRFATVVVASTESSEAGKLGADFVCDGSVSDDVVIQEALDYIDTLPGGYTGEILFLEGRFTLGARLAAPEVEVSLRGLGPRQSIIVGYGISDLNLSLGRVSDICWRQCTNAIEWSCNELVTQIDHCAFDRCAGAIRSYLGGNVANSFVDTNVSIHDNTFYGCTGNVIDLGRRALGIAIHHNVMNNGFAAYGIHVKSLVADAHDMVSIIGNQQAFHDDVLVENCDTVTFVGNTGADLAFTDVDYFTISANIFDSYTETTCTNGAVPAGANVGTGFP